MILGRLIGLLLVVILGSIAAQEFYKAVVPLIPLLGVLVIGAVVFGGWIRHRRRF